MATFDLGISVRTRGGVFAARAIWALRFLIGVSRAQRWAHGAAIRLARWRVGSKGRWRRF